MTEDTPEPTNEELRAPWEPSVNDIPDDELLRRSIGRRGHGRKKPRWVRVMDRFSLGSTYARQLCRRYGFDPDEEVGA